MEFGKTIVKLDIQSCNWLCGLPGLVNTVMPVCKNDKPILGEWV